MDSKLSFDFLVRADPVVEGHVFGAAIRGVSGIEESADSLWKPRQDKGVQRQRAGRVLGVA